MLLFLIPFTVLFTKFSLPLDSLNVDLRQVLALLSALYSLHFPGNLLPLRESTLDDICISMSLTLF